MHTTDRLRTAAKGAIPAMVLAALAFGASPALAAPPPNDAFNMALSAQDGSVTGTNVDATREVGEPNHQADRAARASIWYVFTAPANGTAKIDTCQSEFNTVLGIYEGNAVGALRKLASDDDSCGGVGTSRTAVPVTRGQTLRIAVAGWTDQADFYQTGFVKLRVAFAPTTAPGPTPTPAPPTTGPGVLSLNPPGPLFTGQKRTLRASRSGRFTFAFLAQPGLTGKVTLKSAKKLRLRPRGRKKRLSLGRKSFAVPGNATVKLRFKLSRKNRRVLRKKRKIKVKASMVLRNAAGKRTVATRRFTLKAPKRKRP